MKLVLISDTHGKHRSVQVPDGDVLVHAGDICYSFGEDSQAELFQRNLKQIADLNAWMGDLPHKHKIVIAGNHDFLFEVHPEEARGLFTNATYLEDSSVEIEGFHFYGAPYQPWFGGWAFNASPQDLAEKWALVPENTDVLITHGPPRGVCDRVGRRRVGCTELARELPRIKPKLHVFGHIHVGYGAARGKALYVNAALVGSDYQIRNPPWVVYLDEDGAFLES